MPERRIPSALDDDRSASGERLPDESRTYASIRSMNSGSRTSFAPDPRELGLPLAGERRALHLGVDEVDEPDALLGGGRAFPCRST